ncbi:hypothetical protein B0H10DRAFT_1946287 [Mycena sp. CBHHK59/15]|nr:hypothetical protein B0H10DRAFT_1946287 [Mycena sp. CBHHK59/15]
MPGILQSAGVPANRVLALSERHTLFLGVGIVSAFIFASYGTMKILERIQVWNTSSTNIGMYLELRTPMSEFVLRPVNNRPLIISSRKVFHGGPYTGVITYTRTSPHLQHINAPRSYAIQHRRKIYRRRLGPSPLRSVTSISLQSELAVSHPAIEDAARSASNSDTRSSDIGYRSTEYMSKKVADPLVALKQIKPDFTKDTPSNVSMEIAPLYPSVEELHSIAEDIVGAHSDVLPLLNRVSPLGQRTFFPWVTSSAASPDFKSCLVHTIDTTPGQNIPVTKAEASHHRAIHLEAPLQDNNLVKHVVKSRKVARKLFRSRAHADTTEIYNGKENTSIV